MEMMTRMRLAQLETVVIEQVEKPTAQKGEVLIKVAKVGVCGTDIHAYYGRHPYIHCPIVLGHEFSGMVEAVGEEVNLVKAGERVTVIPHLGCGECGPCKNRQYNYCEKLRCLGCQAPGAYAQYITVPQHLVVKLCDSISYEDGAFVEPAAVAYHGIKRGMCAGDNAVIMGAGAIGIMAAQFAKVLGAKKVVVTDIKQNRLDIALALGADAVINLSGETLEEGLCRQFGSSKNVDFFGDYVGASGQALDQIIQVARRGAHITCVGIIANKYSIPHLPDIIEHELSIFGSSMYIPQDYIEIISLMEQGKVITKGLVTHHYALEDMPKMYSMVADGKESFVKIMVDVWDV